MDLSDRPSRTECARQAERWRQLADTATTPRLRQQLIDKALEYEALAGSFDLMGPPKGEPHRKRPGGGTTGPRFLSGEAARRGAPLTIIRRSVGLP
jgi:hypothetical protein